MIVEEIMHSDVYSLSPQHKMRDALDLMRDKKIRHIPIVNEQQKVLGIVTDHDIKVAIPSYVSEEEKANIYNLPLEEIMVKNPIIAHPLDFVEEIAVLFYEHKISCVPIVSSGRLVGMITTTDVLYRYIELTGANQPGSKLDIRVDHKPGALYEILGVISAHHGNVLSVLIYPDSDHTDSRILSIRIQMINPLGIIEDLREKGFDVLWPHLPGVSL